MNIDLECLKKLAKKATAGPWASHTDGTVFYIDSYDIPRDICVPESQDNSDYIAAASPDVILALIAENERLKALCNWDIGALKVLGILPEDMTEVNMDAGARDAAMQKLQDMEFKKIKQLEAEADWLVEYGAGKEQCPFFEFLYGDAEPIPDWCEGSETVEDGFDCPNDPVECWRKVACKAVEASNA